MTASKPIPLWNQLTFDLDAGTVQMTRSAQKQKYYVVWKGRRTGIFETWEECAAQVKGFTGARYKAFPTRLEAEQAFRNGPGKPVSLAERITSQEKPILQSLSVDAACSGVPGPLEYRGVHTRTGEEIFHEGPFENGTNNVGEFLAIVQALQWLKRKQLSEPVYSDSVTALKWVRRKVCHTTLVKDKSNAKLFKRIAQAEQWLRENELKTPILKWATSKWGEIPADFGRK